MSVTIGGAVTLIFEPLFDSLIYPDSVVTGGGISGYIGDSVGTGIQLISTILGIYFIVLAIKGIVKINKQKRAPAR